MRNMSTMIKLILLAMLAQAGAWAQATTYGLTGKGTIDFTGASITVGQGVGTNAQRPTTSCKPGQSYYQTDGTPGLYNNAATGTCTWTLVGSGGTGNPAQWVTVSYSATPTFTATANTVTGFYMLLTGSVSSSTLASPSTGQILIYNICQNGTGGFTFVPPSNVLKMGTVDPTANACSQQIFQYDGTNANAVSPMLVTGGTGSSITLPGATSGSLTLKPADISGTSSIKFPNGVTDFTATGGTSQVVKQVTSGAPFTVGQLTCGDLSGGCSGVVTIIDERPITFNYYNQATGTNFEGPVEIQNTATAPVVTQVGSTQSYGALNFSNSGTPTIVIRSVLPSTWTGAIDADVFWADQCCGSGNVGWKWIIACGPAGSGNYKDISFANTASSVTTATGGGGTMPKKSSVTSIVTTGCSAGDPIYFQLTRDNTVGSNAAGSITGLYAVLRFRKTNQ